MRCKTIVPGYILTVGSVLSSTECDVLMRDAAAQRWNPRGQRDGARTTFERPELAQILWRRLLEHAPAVVDGAEAVGLNERFRVMRYDQDERFARHIDSPKTVDGRTASRFSMLVYLNDGYRGGDTIFRQLKVHPRQGSALLFRHELEHQAGRVMAGTKFVLRTDLLYRRPRTARTPEWPVGLVTGRHP
ncbi:MAG: 2OG-Fe(II) oxygenase [Proteobacteria bacterium]|nr:2OG-Fe(II) oxygenase [Pseudomonadota bacterium]